MNEAMQSQKENTRGWIPIKGLLVTNLTQRFI